MMRVMVFVCVCFLLPGSKTLLAADHDYKKVVKEDLWGKLYKDGGASFYQRKAFEKNSPLLTESHVYPTSRVRDHLQCGTHRSCLRSSERYQEVISDLHNIVIAELNLAFKLKASVFGILDDTIEKDNSGMRIHLHMVEPSDDRKGDVARILFYMHSRYELPLPSSAADLNLWSQNDPPSKEERLRNARIAEIQGNENPYVSSP